MGIGNGQCIGYMKHWHWCIVRLVQEISTEVNIHNGLWHYNIGQRARHKWNRRRQGCLGHMKIGHRATDHMITYGEGDI